MNKSKLSIGGFVVWVACAIYFYLIAIPTYERSECQSDYSSLFKTPVTDVTFSDASHGHGHNWYSLKANSGKLVLRNDRGFRSIKCAGTPFMPTDKNWVTRCFFQRHDGYLTGYNDDAWVYADAIFSRAFVVEDDRFLQREHTSAEPTEDPLITKIFRDPIVNYAEWYTRDNVVYFELYSPDDPALHRDPQLQLQQALAFKSIDPNSPGVTFPPRNRKESWMIKCFHHSPSSPADHDEIWVFLDNTRTHAFVIARHMP